MRRSRGKTTSTPWMSPEDTPALREIVREFAVVYRSTKDGRQSRRHLEECSDILGIDVPIATIRTRQLDRLVFVLQERGLSNKTVNRYMAPFSKFLRWAHARDLIPGVPMIPRLPEGPGRDTVLSPADEERLLTWFAASTRPDMGIITRVLLATGFRISELLGRHPRHLRDGWLYLERGETKNDDPRAIPLSDDLAADLRPLLSAGMPGYNTVCTWFKKAREALGMPGITPHVLRHTAATRLNASGVTTATLMAFMGHRSVVTSMRYVKVQRDSIREAAALLQGKPLQQT